MKIHTSHRKDEQAMSKVLAVILAGGQGERLSLLSQKRAKPAVPFAGKYRIIDFALSNCVNSGIADVAVMTQYRPHSLHDHIGIGKPWYWIGNRAASACSNPIWAIMSQTGTRAPRTLSIRISASLWRHAAIMCSSLQATISTAWTMGL